MCPKTDDERREMAKIPYQEAIGCLLYAAQITRPDICFAVSFLSRFNIDHGQAHWTAVKRVLRYLKGTIDAQLTFRPDGNGEIIGFCDADYAGDADARLSTTGYMYQLQGGAISWSSKRQKTVALSSTEAEFMSVVAAMQEALWFKRFESEMFLQAPPTIVLYCDNQGAMSLCKNQNYSSLTKHIAVRRYFILQRIYREGAEEDEEIQRIVKLKYKKTNEMVADILTKPVNNAILSKLAPQFGLNKLQAID